MHDYDLRGLESSIEYLTGLSANYLRNTPIDEIRRQVETSSGRKMKITGIATRVVNIFSDKITVLD